MSYKSKSFSMNSLFDCRSRPKFPPFFIRLMISLAIVSDQDNLIQSHPKHFHKAVKRASLRNSPGIAQGVSNATLRERPWSTEYDTEGFYSLAL